MSKTSKVNKQEAVFTKVAKAGKRSVLRSQMNEREAKEFHRRDIQRLLASVTYE